MRKFAAMAFLLALGSTGPLLAPPAHADAAGVVGERHALMKEMGKNLGVVKGFLTENKGSSADVAAAAGVVAADADKIPSLFPEGTDLNAMPDDNEAKPEIWSNWSDFQAKAQALHEAALALASAAEGGDKAAIGAAFGDVGKSCSACHSTYRK